MKKLGKTETSYLVSAGDPINDAAIVSCWFFSDTQQAAMGRVVRITTKVIGFF